MLKKILDFISKKKIVYEYKKINKKIFKKNYLNSNSQILVEFNAFHSDHIILSYLANVLANKFKSKIISFHNYGLIISDINYNIIKSLKWSISKFIKYKNFGIYDSFGVADVFRPKISIEQEKKALIIFNKEIAKIKSKKSIYNIRFNKILFGDLIYDTYLKKYYYPTIDINNKKFKNFLLDFLKLIIFWDEYLSKNKVKAVLGVHAQYSYGIIHRLAIFKNIICLLHAEGRVYKLTKKSMFQHSEYKYYKITFNKFPKKLKKKALKLGEKLIDNRLGGAIGIKSGQAYISKSSFSKTKNIKQKKILKQNNRLNILVATQDFFDSVNGYGKTFFSDSYEWLEFCGKLSERTNYNWYIKDHPTYSGKYKKYQPFTSSITKQICKKYKNLIMIPPNTSHKQLIDNGIDFVFTMYGSIQFEYPYFNIPVLTASRNTPTINYNFCIHSKGLNDYKKKIFRLNQINKKINKAQIKEFYFMNFIYHNQDIIYPLYSKYNKIYKKFDLYWSEKFYEFWCNNFTNIEHVNTIKVIENFLKSTDITTNITHLNDKNIFEKIFKKF
jgi:hypothetical protein